MIAYLKGQVLDAGEDHVILENQGVGYQVHLTSQTLQQLPSEGEPAEFHIYTQVREDALLLYGFQRKAEKEFFLALLKVNGVGPKMAMSVLSAASVERLQEMVEAGDVKALTSLPRVGKKTAEQMILGLKGKLVLAPEKPAAPMASNVQEITFALCNLGFKPAEVEKVVEKMDPGVEVSEGIRAGLRALSQL